MKKKDNAKKLEAKAQKLEAKNKKKQEKKEAKSKKKKEKQEAKAKKRQTKQAAAAKKQQAKAGKKGQAEGAEQQGKRRLNLKVVIPLLLVLAAAGGAGFHFFWPGGEELQPPAAYIIADESTIVLDGFLTEGGKIKSINIQLPEEDGDEPAEDEPMGDENSADGKDEAAEPQAVPIDATAVYEYTGVTPAALQQYVAALQAEEEGFILVDEEYKKLEEQPDFGGAAADAENQESAEDKSDDKKSDDKKDAEEGEELPPMTDGAILLAREAGAEGRLFQLAISWTAKGESVIAVSCPQAAFPQEPTLTSQGALDYIKAQKPSDLGLPGESMDAYHVYNQEGSVVIDGKIYRKFYVYALDEKTNTNAYVGEYLISSTGNIIYKQDRLTGELEQVK